MPTEYKEIINLLKKYIESKKILDYELTKEKDEPMLWKCEITFACREPVNPKTELKTFFYLNFSDKKYENNGKISVFNIFETNSSFEFFLKEQICSREKGELTELRTLGISKKIKRVTPNLKVLSVKRSNEYTDITKKIDLHFSMHYRYEGEYTSFKGTHIFTTPIQVKSSEKYQDLHKKKNPAIPSIVVTKFMSEEEIKNKLCVLLSNYATFTIMQLYLEELRKSKKRDEKNITMMEKSIHDYMMSHLHL